MRIWLALGMVLTPVLLHGSARGLPLTIEPVGNTLLTARFDLVDLDADGTDEVVSLSGNHIYVYKWMGDQLGLLAQVSFPREPVLRLAGCADIDGDGQQEFGLSLLEPDTLKVLAYGLHDGAVVREVSLSLARIDVGGILDEKGPYPWDAAANILGLLPGDDGPPAVIVGLCAGYSCQPRGVIAFDPVPPHRERWRRLIGPCPETPPTVIAGPTPAETRIVLAGASFTNGAFGSGLSDSTAAVFAVDGSGGISWCEEIGGSGILVRYAVADLDGDGRLEVVTVGRSQASGLERSVPIAVRDLRDGRLLRQVDPGGRVIGLATANLDRVGGEEILVILESGRLRVYDGELRPRGDAVVGAITASLLVAEDLTGDACPEIVIHSQHAGRVRILDCRLRTLGEAGIDGVSVMHGIDCRVLHIAPARRLLALHVPDRLALFEVKRVSLAGLPAYWIRTGAWRRAALPAGVSLSVALLGLGLLVHWRRWVRSDGVGGRVQALVADLKIIRHGVRAAGEKPEPLVRLRRGLATCAEPGGYRVGMAILEDCAGTYESCVLPTLRRIERGAWLLLPTRLAVALRRELRRATSTLGSALTCARANPQASSEALQRSCRQAEASLQALESHLRIAEARALGMIQADPLAEVNAACEALGPAMRESGVAFGGIEVTGEPGARVFIEASELRRCLHDMLMNAVEASREAAGPRVGVTVACGERRVAIRVFDNGCGVALEDREAIFHGRSTKVPPGGAGLSHARMAAEAHSGQVRVRESVPWEKTEFEIELCRVPS